jgi:hypothetical protein
LESLGASTFAASPGGSASIEVNQDSEVSVRNQAEGRENSRVQALSKEEIDTIGKIEDKEHQPQEKPLPGE